MVKDKNKIINGIISKKIAYSTLNEVKKKDKDILIAAISDDWFNLYFADVVLKDDFEIASLAINKNGAALRYCSDRLKDNKDLAFKAISKTPSAYKYLINLKSDMDLIELMISKEFQKLVDVPDEIIKNTSVLNRLLSIIENNYETSKNYSNFIENKFMISVIEKLKVNEDYAKIIEKLDKKTLNIDLKREVLKIIFNQYEKEFLLINISKSNKKINKLKF